MRLAADHRRAGAFGGGGEGSRDALATMTALGSIGSSWIMQILPQRQAAPISPLLPAVRRRSAVDRLPHYAAERWSSDRIKPADIRGLAVHSIVAL